MERLTKKISKTVQDEYSLGSYLQYDFANVGDINRLLNKLGGFEDFMEANKFESIEELQNALNGEFEHIFDEKHRIWIKIVEDKTYVEKRNGILEERWQKLKECLESIDNANWITRQGVLRAMQELEKE